MAYTKQPWSDWSSGIPTADQVVNAARLGHLEDGVEAAAAKADAAATPADVAAASDSDAAYTDQQVSALELKLSALFGRPTSPTNLSVSTRTAVAITLTWTASTPPPGGSTTNYRVFKNGVVVAGSTGTTATTYAVTGLTANTTYDFYVIPSNSAGDGPQSATVTATTLPTSTPTVRFPGDPSAGKLYIGATYNSYSEDWFDKHVFPGATTSDPPTKRTKLSRIYNSPGSFAIDKTSKLQSNAAAGRISVFSWKGISDGGTGGPYSVAQIVAGAADADIDANATIMAGINGTIWCAFYHEPEQLNATVNTTLMDNYRAAARRQVTRIRAIASNVAFCSPFFTSDNWTSANRNTSADPRWFHPNYTGDPRTQGQAGGGHWLSDGPFSGSWVNMDGIDYYNPTVGSNITTSSTNKTFMFKFQQFLDRRTADGWYNLPTVIGEGGFYNHVSTLTSGGVSNDDQFADMLTNGTANGVVGCVLWNYSRALYDNTSDLYPTVGSKSAALKAEVLANPTKVVMG